MKSFLLSGTRTTGYAYRTHQTSFPISCHTQILNLRHLINLNVKPNFIDFRRKDRRIQMGHRMHYQLNKIVILHQDCLLKDTIKK